MTFDVPGPFATKGSTVSFLDRRGVLRTKTDSKHGRSFAAAVSWSARSAGVVKVPKGRGVVIVASFVFPRPQGRDRGRLVPCVRPDLDKLLRALLDALTGVAYDDDGQVVGISARKLYQDRLAGQVVVTVEPT